MKQEKKQFDGEKKRGRLWGLPAGRGCRSTFSIWLPAFSAAARQHAAPGGGVGIGGGVCRRGRRLWRLRLAAVRRDLQNAQLPPADGGDS